MKNSLRIHKWTHNEFNIFILGVLTRPHLTLPAGSTLLAGDSMNGRQIQWTGRKKAALYRQYSYGILLVQLCCTVGATMLSLLV